MNRSDVIFLATLWSASLHAGPREDALTEFEKFFAYFTTDNMATWQSERALDGR